MKIHKKRTTTKLQVIKYLAVFTLAVETCRAGAEDTVKILYEEECDSDYGEELSISSPRECACKPKGR